MMGFDLPDGVRAALQLSNDQPTAPALIAAGQATHASAALLEHAVHGGGFGDSDPVALLAEALAHNVSVQEQLAEPSDAEWLASLAELRSIAARYALRWGS